MRPAAAAELAISKDADNLIFMQQSCFQASFFLQSIA
jgi:hypothetical protein